MHPNFGGWNGMTLRAVLGAGSIATAVAGGRPLAAQSQKLDLLWAKLSADISRVDREFEGVMGVAIKDLTDGRTYYLNADEVMPTASMIKIAVLAELFRQDRLGDLYRVDAKDGLPGDDILTRLTSGITSLTLRDVAVLMVAISDNSATNVLIDRLGMAAVNRTLDSLGLRSTRLNRKMIDITAAKEGRENLSTPREMVMLLEAIHRGQVFEPARREAFLTILGIHKEAYLGRDLPEGAPLFNKPGWLEGVRTDAALGNPPGRPFAIAVMTTYGPPDRRAEDAIATIGRIAFRFFERLGGASSYGRDIR